MQWLPLAASLVLAAMVVPAAVRALARQGLTRENYRGAQVAFPAGVVIALTALLALGPLAVADLLADEPALLLSSGAIVFVVGVALLGLVDDVAGRGVAERGWRGHAAALADGRLSTGALKAAGTVALALYALADPGVDAGEYLLAVAVLVLATHVFNLLDLRPGRSIKALLLLGAALTIGTLEVEPLQALGLFLGPIVVLLPLDLRERGMLGDTGSSAVGAVAGLWLVFSLDTTGQLIALAAMAVASVYGEFRSISGLIEKTPLVRQLDSLGRSHV